MEIFRRKKCLRVQKVRGLKFLEDKTFLRVHILFLDFKLFLNVKTLGGLVITSLYKHGHPPFKNDIEP